MAKNRISKMYRETKKSVFLVYLILRILVLLCIIIQITNKNWNNVFYCIMALILFTLPYFVSKNFKIRIPNLLEIIIMVFIFSAMILGEVNRFYLTIPHFDTILHTINGFICCAIGFSLVDLLNDNVESFNLNPFFRVMFAFCFSMTIGVLWEFLEFGCDKFFKSDMQKDTYIKRIASVDLNKDKINKSVILNDIEEVTIKYNGDQVITLDGYLDIGLYDTMKDLLVNFLGAIVFGIIEWFYFNNKDKLKFTEQLFLYKNATENSQKAS